MGSEGRGEQLLKTDQDNGLVAARRRTHARRRRGSGLCERFSAALRDFGYPDCPGGIMVSNPAWRRGASDFAADRAPLAAAARPRRPDGAGDLHRRPCGRRRRLAAGAACAPRSIALVATDDALLGRFAAAIDSFPEASGGWWNRLLLIGEHDQQTLDLKKAGIFPIVHGVRSLALREHVQATGHGRRDSMRWSRRAACRPTWRTDLADSLHFLMGLKLKAGLAEIDTGRAGDAAAFELDQLSSLERDLLKDALAVVKRFKALVRHQFHLERL